MRPTTGGRAVDGVSDRASQTNTASSGAAAARMASAPNPHSNRRLHRCPPHAAGGHVSAPRRPVAPRARAGRASVLSRNCAARSRETPASAVNSVRSIGDCRPADEVVRHQSAAARAGPGSDRARASTPARAGAGPTTSGRPRPRSGARTETAAPPRRSKWDVHAARSRHTARCSCGSSSGMTALLRSHDLLGEPDDERQLDAHRRMRLALEPVRQRVHRLGGTCSMTARQHSTSRAPVAARAAVCGSPAG